MVDRQIGHAIDISYWQHQAPPAAWQRPETPWTTACIVRAHYGLTRDIRVEKHFETARRHFNHAGMYFFWRKDRLMEEQLRDWLMTSRQLGLGKEGTDIAPILDVESETSFGRTLDHEDAHRVEYLLHSLALDFGVEPMLYLNQRDWLLLGSPHRLLKYPIWWADYTGGAVYPEGADVRMRQHRVSRWAGPKASPAFIAQSGAIDHNQIFRPLPTFGDAS